MTDNPGRIDHSASSRSPAVPDSRAYLAEKLYLLVDKAIDQGWQTKLRLGFLITILGGIVVALEIAIRG